MSEKREHLRVINTHLQEIRYRLTLVYDGSATKEQRHAHLEATDALSQFQNRQIKDLRRAFLGRLRRVSPCFKR